MGQQVSASSRLVHAIGLGVGHYGFNLQCPYIVRLAVYIVILRRIYWLDMLTCGLIWAGGSGGLVVPSCGSLGCQGAGICLHLDSGRLFAPLLPLASEVW